jgi:molybdopterin-containing oxidoreductase family membrane subunit
MRPLGPAGWRFWTLAVILGALVAVGLAAYVYQINSGLGVTGMSDQVFWGVYTANFVAFIGISYGGAVVSAILKLTGASWRAPIARLAEAMAVVALAIGALFPLIHLGRPDRAWEMIVHGRLASPLVWDMIAIATYLVATLIFFALPLIPDLAICRDTIGRSAGFLRRSLYTILSLGWRGLPEQRRFLAWGTTVMAVMIIPLAISVHSVLAWAFSVTSRAGWHSTIFGPYFVIAALFSGVATVILVVAVFRKAYHLEKFIGEKQIRNLSYIMLALGLLYLYFTFAEFMTEGYALDEETQVLYENLLLKNYAPLFWLFIIGGLIVPLMLVAIPRTRTVQGIVAAAALAVAGMWLKRFLIVVPPLARPLQSDGGAIYSPSWAEAAITIGAAAAIPLMMMMIVRIFPILSIHEMEEEAVSGLENEPEGRMSLHEARRPA